MKNIWGIALGLFLIAGCHTSKIPVRYTLSEPQDPASLSTLRYQYPDAEGVYLFYNHSITHDLKPDFKINAPRWYFLESYHWREAVLQDRPGEEDRPFEIVLAANESLRYAKFRVIDAAAGERVYHRKNLSKKRVSGDSTRYWLRDVMVEEGMVLEAAYEVERSDLYDHPPLSHDVAFQRNRPMQQYTFDFTYPRDWDIQIKRVGMNREVTLTESRQEREETIALRYTADRVPAFVNEDYRPFYKEVAPYFHVQMRAFEVGNVLAYQAPEAWEHIAEQYRTYAGDYGRKVKSRVEEVAASLELSSSLPASTRIAIVLAHVESEIEFSRHSEVEAVAKEGRGNPYAVTAYAKALLEASGISADYMIAHSAEGGYFDQTFISHEQLYMPLLRVSHRDKPLYLFPGMRRVPAGYIPPAYERQPAILFAEGSYEGIETLPGAPRTAYTDRGDYDVFIDYDGVVRVKAAIDYGAYSAYQFNQRLFVSGRDKMGQLAKELLPHDTLQVSGFVYRIEEAGFGKPMQLRAEYTLNGCFDELGDTFVLRSCGLFDPAGKNWYPFDEKPTQGDATPWRRQTRQPGIGDVSGAVGIVYRSC